MIFDGFKSFIDALNNSTLWSAIGAIGQWVCAIATFCAVKVALKPYYRRIKVDLISVIIKINDNSEVVPFILQVQNKGFNKEKIAGIYITANDGRFVLSKEQIVIEKAGTRNVSLNPDGLWNNLRLVDDKHFRFLVQDSAGYCFYSKKYRTEKYKKIISTNKPLIK